MCSCAPFESCFECLPEEHRAPYSRAYITPTPAPKITVIGGTELTLDEAKVALEEAMRVIECVGTTGIYRQGERAEKWMKKYFPNWA